MVSYEEFKEKGYYVVPTDPDWDKYTAPASRTSTRTPRAIRSRPPPARWSSTPRTWPSTSPTTPSGRRCRTGSRRASATTSASPASGRPTYPLLVLSNHPRWRCHANHDDITWLREIATCKVGGPGRLQVRAAVDQPGGRRSRGASKRATWSRSSTSGARCSAGPTSPSGSCPARSTWITGPATTPSCPGNWTGAGPSTPSPRTTSPPRTPPAWCPAASWSRWSAPTWTTCAAAIPRRSPGRITRAPGCAWSGCWHAAKPRRGRRRGATLDRRGRCLMGKVMIIDLALCNGCHNCQVACKDEHCANDWSPIARPQPDTGQFWNKVVHMERGSFPKVQVTYHHSICQHCEDAPCLAACPSNAIYRRDDGIVIIDPGKCCGNKMCIAACPYEGVIYFNEHLNMAQKCTFCAHLLDRGWAEPRCSDACPTGAFTFGDDSDPAIAGQDRRRRTPQARARHPPARLLPQPAQEVDRRRGLRPGGRRGHPGRHGHRHQHGDRRHRHGHHRPLRRLLAEGPGRGQLHPGHREAGLPRQEAGADRRHG